MLFSVFIVVYCCCLCCRCCYRCCCCCCQLHPGMTPANNVIEVLTSCLFTPLCRMIALFYILSWDSLVKKHTLSEHSNTNINIDSKMNEQKKTK